MNVSDRSTATIHPVRPPEVWRTLNCRHLDESARWPAESIQAQLPHFPGWTAITLPDANAGDPGQTALRRTCLFADFNALEPVVTRLMLIARLQDHHPDVQFGYRNLTVTWNTHSAGGVSDNDWVCAALFEQALAAVAR